MKKQMKLVVADKTIINNRYFKLKLGVRNGDIMPEIIPGQFVNVLVEGSENTFLRRPISVFDYDADGQELDLLVRIAGSGTMQLSKVEAGEEIDVVLPLGNGFVTEGVTGKRILLIGGGVGVAPLFYYGKALLRNGGCPVFLLGARTDNDILMRHDFESIAETHCVTESGETGEKGFVTDSRVLKDMDFDMWVCCGPLPMMKKIALLARQKGVECFVSLENMMACGIGACLCCVEKTHAGHKCVCTSGPVFNIKELLW